jgi:ATP-dependent DNA ligase
MNIKTILDEIAAEPGSNAKMDILRKYQDNELLKKVMYAAKSPRIKYYIKQIPEHCFDLSYDYVKLEDALRNLSKLSNREYTGGQASQWLQSILNSLSEDDAYIIVRIIEKDLKIGMGTSNINKVFPKLIEKTPYMGAKAFNEGLAKDIISNGMAYSQIKMDGRYCNAIIEDGEVYLESRSGEETYLPGSKIMSDFKMFDEDCVVNGELTIAGIDRNESNGVINSAISISKKIKDGELATKDKEHMFERHNMTYEQVLENIIFTAWDIIDLVDYKNKKSDIPYNDRLHRIMIFIIEHQDDSVGGIEIVEQKLVSTYKDAMEHFVEALNRGLEGTILKTFNGTWKDGKPNWQIKMKLEIDIDMKVIGFNYGTVGSKNEHVISSLTVESSDGKVTTKPTGIKEKDMKMITENQEALMGSIIEMKCCGLSHDRDGNYSTLHPVFKSIRDDKDDADSFESIQEIENMAKSLA